ncbi:hypothetical protein IP92_05758 [Pseudoduganella flava]|uniref:DUF4355 domain-containing protein n=1 Tax=Pseudoduganella flava TaxID=871742 RepID=A0A562P9E1_9BURK|nr:hypothetical protein [Pseudoduganella flava]QGZ42709.1 hypothetical protein GO485_29200 [Pseudoduganella flava]TWI41038.1 hypothetical protein IP92_05758 [Pseudoduganella flava]
MTTEQPQNTDSELPNTTADSDEHNDPNPAGDELEGEGAEGGEQPEEEEEIEVDGRKFVLPKTAAQKLQAERLMQADYTRKTQEAAEVRKAAEAEREAVARERETQQQFVKEMAKVEALNDQLAVFDQLNWDELIANDPQNAMLYQQRQRQLEAERNKAVEAVTQKQQQFALNEQQEIAKQVQEAEAYVQREIPGWSPQRAEALNKYLSDNGVKVDKSVGRLLIQQPALLKLIDRAEKFAQLEKKQAEKTAAPPVPPPATRVSAARPGAQRDPAKMSTAEWMAHRNSQVRKR